MFKDQIIFKKISGPKDFFFNDQVFNYCISPFVEFGIKKVAEYYSTPERVKQLNQRIDHRQNCLLEAIYSALLKHEDAQALLKSKILKFAYVDSIFYDPDKDQFEVLWLFSGNKPITTTLKIDRTLQPHTKVEELVKSNSEFFKIVLLQGDSYLWLGGQHDFKKKLPAAKEKMATATFEYYTILTAPEPKKEVVPGLVLNELKTCQLERPQYTSVYKNLEGTEQGQDPFRHRSKDISTQNTSSCTQSFPKVSTPISQSIHTDSISKKEGGCNPVAPRIETKDSTFPTTAQHPEDPNLKAFALKVTTLMCILKYNDEIWRKKVHWSRKTMPKGIAQLNEKIGDYDGQELSPERAKAIWETLKKESQAIEDRSYYTLSFFGLFTLIKIPTLSKILTRDKATTLFYNVLKNTNHPGISKAIIVGQFNRQGFKTAAPSA